jgi:hypothetical protein
MLKREEPLAVHFRTDRGSKILIRWIITDNNLRNGIRICAANLPFCTL